MIGSKLNKISITLLCLVLSILGFIFSLKFQEMAYWGENGSLTMAWYWTGAALSYIFAIGAVVPLPKTAKIVTKVEFLLRLLTLILIIITLFLTTTIIIAWQSGV